VPVTFEEFDLLSVLSQSYPVMTEPPVLGADHETMSSPLLVVTVGVFGAWGTVVIVTLEDAEDSRDVPAEFVAVNTKVYPVLESNPPTTIGEADPVRLVAVVSTVVPFL
jgi:hypothetical protein